MRLGFVLGVFFNCCGLAHAQYITLDPPEVGIEGDPTVIVTPTMQISNSGELQVMRWKRVVNDLPEGWTSTVMDPLIHWTAETDLSTIGFPLPGDSTETMWVHFDARNYHDGIYEPVPGCGTVVLEIFSETDSLNYHAMGIFHAYLGVAMEDCDVPVAEYHTVNSIEVFPNPAADVLHVVAGADVRMHGIDLYSIDGKLIQSTLLEDADFTAELNVSNIPDGIYLIKICDDKNLLLFTEEVIIKK